MAEKEGSMAMGVPTIRFEFDASPTVVEGSWSWPSCSLDLLASLFCFLRSALQRSLHVLTSSQQRSHTLRHVKGRLHTSHSFDGKFSFFTPRGILPYFLTTLLNYLTITSKCSKQLPLVRAASANHYFRKCWNGDSDGVDCGVANGKLQAKLVASSGRHKSASP